MHVTQGRCYSVAEMSEWLHDAGFGAPAILPSAVGRSALLAQRTGNRRSGDQDLLISC
jgi:hypothetical protein